MQYKYEYYMYLIRGIALLRGGGCIEDLRFRNTVSHLTDFSYAVTYRNICYFLLWNLESWEFGVFETLIDFHA